MDDDPYTKGLQAIVDAEDQLWKEKVAQGDVRIVVSDAGPDPRDEEYRASSGAVGAFFAIIFVIAAVALQARADKLQAEALAKCQAHPTPRCSTQ